MIAYRQRRIGHTLLEMVISMASASMLLAGLGAAVAVSGKALRPQSMPQYARTSSAFAEHDLLRDLRLATSFTERTDKAVTFLVPDRDGNGQQERLRYSWSGASGSPVMFEQNGSSPIEVVKDVRAFSLSYVTRTVPGITLPAEVQGSPILLIVNNSASPTATELTRKSMLESWDFVVQMVGTNDDLDKILALAQESKAVYLSGTIEAGKFSIAGKLAEIGMGIVNENPDFVGDVGFASTSTTALVSQIGIIETGHYITSSNSTGTLSVVSLAGNMIRLSGTLSPQMNMLGTTSNSPALATLSPGMSTHDGRVAAGRRVMLPWGTSTIDPLNWNQDAQALTCAAVEWAAGNGDEPASCSAFGHWSVFTSSNGTNNVQYGAKVVLADKATLKFITAYVGGANDLVRYGIYADNSGQPGALIAQSNTGLTTTSLGWITLAMPQSNLNPGTYWVAFCFRNSSQRYRYVSSIANGGERNRSNDAVANGFVSTWGNSGSAYSGGRSIFVTYEVR